MKSIATRIAKLEQQDKNAPPLFLVQFEDGTTKRLDIVQYTFARVDEEIGRSTNKIIGRRLIRGDPAPYRQLREFLKEDW